MLWYSYFYEYEVFVLDGEGIVGEKDVDYCLKVGDVVYVKLDEVY